jgi:Rad3-related DNA helicase
LDNSAHKQYMMTHSTWDRERVVAQFRQSSGPRVLVSPSVDTGYDFYGESSRWQIVVKLPFASTQDPVVKERQKRDPDYGLYRVGQTLEQMTGRIVRAEDDFGETLLADANVEWCVPKLKYKGFVSRAWLQAFKSYDVAPEPVQFE